LLALKEQLKAKEESDKENGRGGSKDTSPDRRSQPSPSNRDSLVDDPARSNRDDARGRDSASAHDDKQVRVVSPPRDKDDKRPIKGILKQPKPAFPEEPNPVREGVAPHKDDKTKGNVPPGARWTKISRKLVNPEALTIGKERFEVREDFVIVLRVLNKEEIEAYTAATAQLRGGLLSFSIFCLEPFRFVVRRRAAHTVTSPVAHVLAPSPSSVPQSQRPLVARARALCLCRRLIFASHSFLDLGFVLPLCSRRWEYSQKMESWLTTHSRNAT
jgi:hypothetical protein